mmetsp:Transcript_23311/g.70023  ORF Transcript_23311/g.70023 Transcript_23311/m.70023 type:complete len:342 (+) Transcript_23311:986-2011(+)
MLSVLHHEHLRHQLRPVELAAAARPAAVPGLLDVAPAEEERGEQLDAREDEDVGVAASRVWVGGPVHEELVDNRRHDRVVERRVAEARDGLPEVGLARFDALLEVVDEQPIVLVGGLKFLLRDVRREAVVLQDVHPHASALVGLGHRGPAEHCVAGEDLHELHAEPPRWAPRTVGRQECDVERFGHLALRKLQLLVNRHKVDVLRGGKASGGLVVARADPDRHRPADAALAVDGDLGDPLRLQAREVAPGELDHVSGRQELVGEAQAACRVLSRFEGAHHELAKHLPEVANFPVRHWLGGLLLGFGRLCDLLVWVPATAALSDLVDNLRGLPSQSRLARTG